MYLYKNGKERGIRDTAQEDRSKLICIGHHTLIQQSTTVSPTHHPVDFSFDCQQGALSWVWSTFPTTFHTVAKETWLTAISALSLAAPGRDVCHTSLCAFFCCWSRKCNGCHQHLFCAIVWLENALLFHDWNNSHSSYTSEIQHSANIFFWSV